MEAFLSSLYISVVSDHSVTSTDADAVQSVTDPCRSPLSASIEFCGYSENFQGVVASTFTGQKAWGSAQRLSKGAETRPSGRQAIQPLALHQTHAMIPGHVRFLGSWFDQDTGVALARPAAVFFHKRAATARPTWQTHPRVGCGAWQAPTNSC